MGPSSGASPALNQAEIGALRSYLNRLFESRQFAPSNRRGQLLRYLVEHALTGATGEVTEYGIGLDVFQRPASFDPRIESVVRVEMSRLRQALANYYGNAGASDPWRIEIPGRSCIPAFVPNPAAPREPAIPPAAPALRRPKMLWAAGLLALIGFGAVAIVRYALPPELRLRSVVVLPFENLTGDPQKEYLADGITEQLTDSLAHIPDLRVVARTSAFQFKGKAIDVRQIGRQLDADVIIEGSLRILDGRLTLTAQVNRAADGYHILSRSLEGGPQELERLAREIVAPVLTAIRPGMVLPGRKQTDPEAYDLFLRAEAYRGDGTFAAFQQALVYLNQAIERDPKYADAHAALAGVYASGANKFTPEPLDYAKRAKAAATTALELDPDCARAFAALGLVDSTISLDWKRGEQELRNAIRLMPQSAVSHNWLGVVLMFQGRFPEALAELRTAENLDPLPAGAGVTLGLGYYLARQYDHAVQQLSKVRDLHPDLITIHPFLGQAWEGKGEFEKAMAEYQLCLPKLPLAAKISIAHLLAVTGKQAEARKMLAGLEHSGQAIDPMSIAAIYAALGERDKAFQSVARAYESRMIWVLKVHPMLDPLRDDPRFGEWLKKAGLS